MRNQTADQIPLTPAMRRLLERERSERERALGRPLAPDDQIFGSLTALSDDQFTAAMQAVLRQLGVGDETIYAVRATGRLVLPRSRSHLSPEAIEEWDTAISDYRAMHTPPGAEPVVDDLDALQRSIDRLIEHLADRHPQVEERTTEA